MTNNEILIMIMSVDNLELLLLLVELALSTSKVT